jgi:hypothetical protein
VASTASAMRRMEAERMGGEATTGNR